MSIVSDNKYDEEDLFDFEEVVDIINNEKEWKSKPSQESLKVILVVFARFAENYGENDEKALILAKMYTEYEKSLKKKKFFGLF